MELRIIGGVYRGTKLVLPDSQQFRPTKNRVREAITSSLLQDIPNASVLELCAGSAIMSLELLSRGAEKATAVELEKKRGTLFFQALKQPLLKEKLTWITADVATFLSSDTSEYDIIFFDPPYYTNELTDLLPQALTLLHPHGVLLFESATDDAYVAQVFSLLEGISIKEKRYGKSYIRTIRKEN